VYEQHTAQDSRLLEAAVPAPASRVQGLSCEPWQHVTSTMTTVLVHPAGTGRA